jgi:hypothetical protein
MINTNGAKILLLDIETAPNEVYTWGLYDQNVGVNQVIKAGYVLCWAAKWLGQKEVMSDAIINYPKYYRENPKCDKKIARSMWKLLDEADIVITHNGDAFDIKWLNTLFITHRLPPPSTFKSIDTKKAAKANFRFISNSLKYIGRHLGIGDKLHHDGFDLWVRCMKGDKKSWQHMIKYCKQDVVLLEKEYLELRPYIKNHPNLALYKESKDKVCPNCASTEVKKKGFAYTSLSIFQRFVCQECGKNFRGNTRIDRSKSK